MGKSKLPILCLDFDGVIHRYSKGWQDGSIYDDVTPGFFDWAMKAQRHFQLVIYSSRSKTIEGIHAMKEWMHNQSRKWAMETQSDSGTFTIPEFSYAQEKPPAFLTIDDRAIQFRGEWWLLPPEILVNFQPWTVKKTSLPLVMEQKISHPIGTA